MRCEHFFFWAIYFLLVCTLTNIANAFEADEISRKHFEIENKYFDKYLTHLDKDDVNIPSTDFFSKLKSTELQKNMSTNEIAELTKIISKHPKAVTKILEHQLKTADHSTTNSIVHLLNYIIIANDKTLVDQAVQLLLNKNGGFPTIPVLESLSNNQLDQAEADKFATFLANFPDYYFNNKASIIQKATTNIYDYNNSFQQQVHIKLIQKKGDIEYLESANKIKHTVLGIIEKEIENFNQCFKLYNELLDYKKSNTDQDITAMNNWRQKTNEHNCQMFHEGSHGLGEDIANCVESNNCIPQPKAMAARTFSRRPSLHSLARDFSLIPYSTEQLDFIKKYLDNFNVLSLHRSIFTVYLMAFKSGNNQLKQEAIKSITSSILGDNYSFNQIEPWIYEQDTKYSGSDDNMEQTYKHEFLERSKVIGYDYYSIPRKVETIENRLGYFIDQIANSIVTYDYNGNGQGGGTSNEIVTILRSLWSEIKIDDDSAIEQAKKILNRPKNDFARISAEAFIASNKGNETLKEYITEIEEKAFFITLENLKSTDLAEAKNIAKRLIYWSNNKEVQEHLKDFLTTKTNSNVSDYEVDQYMVLAAYLSEDSTLIQLAKKYAISKIPLEVDEAPHQWFYPLYEKINYYLSINNQWRSSDVDTPTSAYTADLIDLITLQCNKDFITSQSNSINYFRPNNQVIDIISRCLSKEKIYDTIEAAVENTLGGNNGALEGLIKKISSPDVKYISISKLDLDALEYMFNAGIYISTNTSETTTRWISHLSLYEDQSLLGKIFYYGLNTDEKTKDFTINLIQQRMEGKEPLFNKTLGRIYISDKDRQQYYFLQILHIGRYGPLQIEKILDILSKLNFNYNYIKDVVEEEAKFSSNYTTYPEVEIAQRYIKKIKGNVYLSSALLNSKKNFYLVINGGYDPTSNDQAHEIILESFDRFLFNQEAIIFNAGGPQTPYVPTGKDGFKERDKDGFIKIEESKYPKKTLIANSHDINMVVDNIVKKEPDKVSFTYIGHGGPSGMALWKERMPIEGHRFYLDKFSPETIVQTFISSCHAGANIVAHHRVHPIQTANIFDFLDFHYPKNRCALSNSLENEMSYTRISSNTNPENIIYSKIFKTSPRLTLANFQRILYYDSLKDPEPKNDTAISYKVSTPTLTSDYLIDDISKIICLEHTADITKLTDGNKAFDNNYNSPFFIDIPQNSIKNKLSKDGIKAWDQLIMNFCSNNYRNKLQEFTDKYDIFNKWYGKLQSLISSATLRYIKENMSDVYEEYVTYVNEDEKLTVQSINHESKNKESHNPFHMNDLPPISYQIIRASLENGHNAKFNKYFNSLLFTIMESKEEVIIKTGKVLERHNIYTENNKESKKSGITLSIEDIAFINKHFDQYLKNKEKNMEAISILELFNKKISDSLIEVQFERQNYIKHFRGKIRNSVEELLNDPYLMVIRRQYESIQHCENIPFN